MLVYYHEAMCHAEKLVHYLHCQGHSEGLCNQNMIIFTLSRAATFPAVAGIPAWRKIRKAFSGLAKLTMVCSSLMKFLSRLAQLV